MDLLNEKTILLGITGGISAYKVPDVASKLCQSGADVDVVMTESATRFIPVDPAEYYRKAGIYGYVEACPRV
jgi:phosphopantothenoylcysteine decarboxylase/phosphopantothenate--cysteine ligase